MTWQLKFLILSNFNFISEPQTTSTSDLTNLTPATSVAVQVLFKTNFVNAKAQRLLISLIAHGKYSKLASYWYLPWYNSFVGVRLTLQNINFVEHNVELDKQKSLWLLCGGSKLVLSEMGMF